MLTEAEREIVKKSWRLVVPIAETAADLFYRRLFELQPPYRDYFKSDMASQKRKLIAMLAFIVKCLDWPDSAWREEVAEENDLFLVVLALGRRHSELYQIPDEAYQTVGEALLWTLNYGLGQAFDDPTRAAWTKIYTLLSTTMKMGRLSARPMKETDQLVERIVAPVVAGAQT
jgi:hemoglobin-like flavoprotein